jgi:AcrR family transcriptional regulator
MGSTARCRLPTIYLHLSNNCFNLAFEMSNDVHTSNKLRSKAGSTSVVADRTRARLLEAAGEVFALVGYENATIREICARAGANVAAVNYHFGDKLGLYTEVLKRSIGASRSEPVLKMFDLDPARPEEILRQFIRAMIQRMCGVDKHELNLRFRLMAHELAQPTPARAPVIDEAIRPVYERLLKLVGALLNLPEDNDKTRLCAHSIVGQIAHYANARPVLASLWPEQKMTAAQMDEIADHIAEFSLAYIRSVSASNEKLKASKKAKRRKC